MKRGRKLVFAALERRNGYRNGVNVLCKAGHCGGMFLCRMQNVVAVGHLEVDFDNGGIKLFFGHRRAVPTQPSRRLNFKISLLSSLSVPKASYLGLLAIQ